MWITYLEYRVDPGYGWTMGNARQFTGAFPSQCLHIQAAVRQAVMAGKLLRPVGKFLRPSMAFYHITTLQVFHNKTITYMGYILQCKCFKKQCFSPKNSGNWTLHGHVQPISSKVNDYRILLVAYILEPANRKFKFHGLFKFPVISIRLLFPHDNLF